MHYKLLLSPWKNEFIDIISKTEEELLISSPFVDIKGITVLSNSIIAKSSVKISLITSLTTQNIINKITEPLALLELYRQFNQVEISSLVRLHAKVYLIDNKMGIITSANLTGGGLINNFEYGILINDIDMVSIIKNDMMKYYSLGNVLDKNLLEDIAEESNKLYSIKVRTENLIKNTRLTKLLKKSAESIELELLKNRVKEGKTINAIFSDTLLYILQKKGPLSTSKLHPLIKAIHPDICNDCIDRVINGQHFGKKWKHLVRNAQQSLKNKGLIYLEDNKWHLGT